MVDPATISAVVSGAVKIGEFIYTCITSSSDDQSLKDEIKNVQEHIENTIEAVKIEIVDEVNKAFISKNYHDAFGCAYTARDLVTRWFSFPNEARIESAQDYWHASENSQKAISLLQTSIDGGYLTPYNMTLEQAALIAMAINIRLNVVAYGSQVFESQKDALIFDISQYTTYMTAGLNNLSEKAELDFLQETKWHFNSANKAMGYYYDSIKNKWYKHEYDPESHKYLNVPVGKPFMPWEEYLKEARQSFTNYPDLLKPVINEWGKGIDTSLPFRHIPKGSPLIHFGNGIKGLFPE